MRQLTPARVFAPVLIALAIMATPGRGDPVQDLAQTVATVTADTGGRLGVVLRNTATGWTWAHRGGDRFALNSTFKSLLCGAVLARADAGTLDLSERLPVPARAILDHAPVTRRHVGKTMTIAALCDATLDLSDNTAANLLLDRLGGPGAVTAFARALGDDYTRLDRMEPALNITTPGDPRDSTTPAAMVANWQALLLGDALSPASRAQFQTWMSNGGATGDLIRPHLPPGWRIADKSGGGRTGSRSVVALIVPPDGPPYLAAIYLAEAGASWADRNAAVSRIGASLVAVITAAQPSE